MPFDLPLLVDVGGRGIVVLTATVPFQPNDLTNPVSEASYNLRVRARVTGDSLELEVTVTLPSPEANPV